MPRVQDIMTTDVVTVTPSMTLRDAAELFARRHIGGAPVVDGRNVVGVVSASDILAFVATSRTADDQDADEDAVWLDADDDGRDRLPDDAASFFADRWSFAEADMVDVFAGTGGGGSTPLDGHTVSEVMTSGILSLPPEADVAIAAEHMRNADVHRLLVMERGSLVGIVSTTDLARAVVADRSPPAGRAISIPRCITSTPPS